LQTGHLDGAEKIFLVVAHADGVVRSRASGGALVTQASAGDAWAIAELSVRREQTIAEDFDALVDVAHTEARDDRLYSLSTRGKCVSHEYDIDVAFEGDDVARREDAAIAFVVPTFVVFMDGFLRSAECGGLGREQEGGFAGEGKASVPAHAVGRGGWDTAGGGSAEGSRFRGTVGRRGAAGR